jgi:hypothetical protein
VQNHLLNGRTATAALDARIWHFSKMFRLRKMARSLHLDANALLCRRQRRIFRIPTKVKERAMSNVTNEGMLRREQGASGQQGTSEGTHGKQRLHEESEATKRGASEAVGAVKEQASELSHTVSQEAGKIASEAKWSAVEAAERLRSEGVSIFSRQKAAAANELLHLRDALNAASDKLREEDDGRIADMTHVVADQLDTAVRYLRDRDLNHLASDVAESARRRPVLFYGGLFAVGLAASRFFKASAHRSQSQRTSQASRSVPSTSALPATSVSPSTSVPPSYGTAGSYRSGQMYGSGGVYGGPMGG